MADNPADKIGQRLKSISSDMKLYVEKRVELVLLGIGQQFSRLMAETIHKLSGIFLLMGGTVCLLVALAIYLGELLNSPSLGYVIVSLPLFVFGYLFLHLKPRSVFENLQDQFESEIMEAFLTNGKEPEDKEKLNLPEPAEEAKSKRNTQI